MRVLRSFLADEGGAALVEYTVLLASFAVAGAALLNVLPRTAATMLSSAYTHFMNLQLCPPPSNGC